MAEPGDKKRGRGRPRNMERCRQAMGLWRQGMALDQISERLGVDRSRVQMMLAAAGEKAELPGVLCCRCRAEIAPRMRSGHRNGPVLCLACLEKNPGAMFGQRLKAYRLAAGITQTELAGRTGIHPRQVGIYEHGAVAPEGPDLAKLVRVLGAGLLVGIGGPDDPRSRSAADR